jgi:hypothetical protein
LPLEFIATDCKETAYSFKANPKQRLHQDITFILQTLCMKEASSLVRKGLLKPPVLLSAP